MSCAPSAGSEKSSVAMDAARPPASRRSRSSLPALPATASPAARALAATRAGGRDHVPASHPPASTSPFTCSVACHCMSQYADTENKSRPHKLAGLTSTCPLLQLSYARTAEH